MDYGRLCVLSCLTIDLFMGTNPNKGDRVMQFSLTSKIMAFITVVFLTTVIGVIGVTVYLSSDITNAIVEVVHSGQNEVYTQMLNGIATELDRALLSFHTMINDTGLTGTNIAKTYEDEAKISVLNDLAKLNYEGNQIKNSDIYPFILDSQMDVIMHPFQKKDDGGLRQVGFADLIAAAKDNVFQYQQNNMSQLVFFKKFEPWGWTICYRVPENLMHKDVYKVSKLLSNMRNQIVLAIVMLAIAVHVALAWFMSRLRRTSNDLTEQIRIKTGQTALSERMRGDQVIEGLAANIVSYLCEYLNASVGAIFICNEEQTFGLAGSYAFQHRKDFRNVFKPGEGLIGQAALEKKHILMTDCPTDYICIRSGLGLAAPKNILAYPLLLNDKVEGIIELGSLKEFSDKDLSFLSEAAENIAIALQSVTSRSQMAKLLDKTVQMAAALQTQQEELRASNEELEEQAKVLRESEVILQTQQEELRATNEELEEQTKALRESQDILQTQQEELRATNEELVEQAESREKQKQEILKKNQEIEKAQKIIQQKAEDLELSSKYKSEFLANMSHELRTPLNSVLLLSRLLSENKGENLSAKQVEFAETIYSSGNDLMNLINDVLDLSKVESGRFDINVSKVNLKIFTDKISRDFQKIAEEKGINFSVNLMENVPQTIRTDSQRLEQIVKNLLSNAIKFTDQGSVSLDIQRPNPETILSQSQLSIEQAVAFSVSDTGIGVKKENQRVIFEAFRQEDGTTSRKYGGTGLGLSISRELAKCLKGEIGLESEQGRGSIFTLYLPESVASTCEDVPEVQGTSLPPSLPAVAPVKKGAGSHSALSDEFDRIRDDRKDIAAGDRCLLVIEDDSRFASILSDLARERDFKVLLAHDGETGLHFADLYKPIAIIMDIGLPGIDGWDVLTRLKEAPVTRHIPVHLISASDPSRNAMKMGAIGYLTKPVSLENLNLAFGKIEQTIDRKVKKLLLAEGNEKQRDAIIQLLEGHDIQITAASTGAVAFEHLQMDSYQCMIMELKLPDMSGTELMDKIRTDEKLAEMPIIIHTDKILSNEEKAMLDKNSGKIILKDTHSLEKLLDETTLFLHRVETDLPDESKNLLKLMHDKESTLAGKSVLLVDDDMRNVFALTHILEEKGLKIIIAKNGREALARLSESVTVDLVLMDIMMPVMDGYEAIQEIRKQGKFQKLPIIALTAKAMRGDRAKCIEAGASDYLAKPVDSGKLFSMLRVWLYK
jgi:tubulin-specific chaperone A